MSEMDVRGDFATDDDVTPEEISIEAPEADAAEQHRLLHDEDRKWPEVIPLEVDPADATEQERTVDLDEDDYR
jgi:hypothetical protein